MILRAAIAFLAVMTCVAGAGTADDVGSAERGQELFRKCSGCHQVGQGAENRIGPHLNGLFGRTAGTAEGFRYSKALTRAGAKGLEWNNDSLASFIASPKVIVPGTRMSFRGYEAPQDQEDLVAYLKTFSTSPANTPKADPTAIGTDHDIAPEILATEGDPEFGEYLSSECKTCHRVDGSDEGIPSIILWPEEDFVVVMHAYKNKTLEHPVMNMLAGRLSNEEIAALAAYFADLEE